MARPLLCQMVAKKSRVSQNVSAIRFVVCVYPRQTNAFFSFSLFLESVPCYYLVVSINVSSSKRNETTGISDVRSFNPSPYFKLRKIKANLKKR